MVKENNETPELITRKEYEKLKNPMVVKEKKIKKDKIFVGIVAVIIASLSYYTIGVILAIRIEPGNLQYWFMLLANIIAIWGTLFLFRTYKRKVRELKKISEENKDGGNGENGTSITGTTAS